MAAAVPVSAGAAKLIFEAFAGYNLEFRRITQRSGYCFNRGDWHGMQVAATDRIDLYDRCITQVLRELEQTLGQQLDNRHTWIQIRQDYSHLIKPLIDRELNKTWFNSISRKIFCTVGVDVAIEFVNIEEGPIGHVSEQVSVRRFVFNGALGPTCRLLLKSSPLFAPWRDQGSCASYLHRELRRQLAKHGGTGAIEYFELVVPVFFRFKRAYIIGRLLLRDSQVPIVIAVANTAEGLIVDRVLTDPSEVSILFGFARSYFHVDLETIADTVVLLRKIMPRKAVSELYTMLGRAKQGKTESYRALFRHLRFARDEFQLAPGISGMVMSVFTLPSWGLVFKVIRDQFAPPKTVKRRDVLERYEMVFRHDRAGRLIEALEFRQLRIRKARFSNPVLTELLEQCSRNVSVAGDHIVLHHLYVERRMIPLNLYLRSASLRQIERVLDDLGQAIKDLACSNIFPGDLLLKNFGVSRHGRVVFYDYDELCLLTDCRFRHLPAARSDQEELSSQTWFSIKENDIFPEQFPSFFGLTGDLLTFFKSHHGELFTAEYWLDVQERLAAGEVIDVPPYNDGRLPPNYF